MVATTTTANSNINLYPTLSDGIFDNYTGITRTRTKQRSMFAVIHELVKYAM